MILSQGPPKIFSEERMKPLAAKLYVRTDHVVFKELCQRVVYHCNTHPIQLPKNPRQQNQKTWGLQAKISKLFFSHIPSSSVT